jgi:hypothetical protein
LDASSPLVVILAVLLYARVGAGRPVPLAAIGLVASAWVLALVAALVTDIWGVIQVNFIDGGAGYGPTGVTYVAWDVFHLVTGSIVVAGALMAASSAPISVTPAPEAPRSA